MQMGGFVCFVITIYLKVSGKKMESILSFLDRLHMKERLIRMLSVYRGISNRFSYMRLLSNL